MPRCILPIIDISLKPHLTALLLWTKEGLVYVYVNNGMK